MKKLFLLILFSLFISISINASNIHSINHIEVFNDSTLNNNIDLIKNKKFEKSRYETPNIESNGFTFWFKFKTLIEDEHPVININNPILETVTLYTFSGKNLIDSSRISNLQSFNKREIKTTSIAFAINQGYFNQELTFYLRVTSKNQILLPVQIGESDLLLENETFKNLIFGIYFGIILVMLLYNLFIFITVKDISYIYYVMYILFVGLTQAIFNGYAYKYIWPNNIWLSQHGLTIIGALSGISMAYFVIDFLGLKKDRKYTVYIYYAIVSLYTLAIVLNIFNQLLFSFNITNICAGLITLFTLYVAIIAVIDGKRTGKFFIVAWSIFLIGVIAFALRNSGVLPYNSYTNYTMPIGSALEVILLSLALADRINILKKDKEESQKREVLALQENKKILAEQNVILEKKVLERTTDLEQTNEELNVTLEHLQDTQVKLVESEKMASLGILTAGIAHEINNPINFVSSNISPLKRDVEDILEVLNEFESIQDSESFQAKLNGINKLKADLDIEFVKTEVFDIIEGISNGASRTSEIVKGLRMFSRLDESEQKKALITDCLESSLTVIQSRIKELAITVNKDFSFQEEISCLPGKLNQVFLNLITNAVDAMESIDTNRELNLSIYKENEYIKIGVKDSGKGITESDQKRIFEPFFTTKAVGKGTGLGMAIVYSIIEEHNGRITVNSEINQGTEITIFIPIKF